HRPPCERGRLGPSPTSILLLGCLAHDRFPWRIRRRALPLPALLPSLLRATGGHDPDPRALPVEAAKVVGHGRTGSRTVLGWRRLREAAHRRPVVVGHRLPKAPFTCARGGGEAGDAPGGPEGSALIRRHAGGGRQVARGARWPAIVGQERGALGSARRIAGRG